jgi:uncharacterized protein YyaL (SSP411 family)
MHNPVDWHPWGPEAFARAKAENKPVFLSIGYAACHWCHVMERESFEDEATARVLNEVFVCVKVDREERPDVDDVYMSAVQLTTGRGGWPMSCFLLPDGRPFLARTYLPRGDLVSVARRIADFWRTNPARLEEAASEIVRHVKENAAASEPEAVRGSDAELVSGAVARLAAAFDRERGGFDRVPKFPPHAALAFLLDRGGEAGGEAGLDMARKTLDGMAAGGVRDHLGGGFHRYSTDAEWLLPHFEKMLYDNALLAAAYARGAATLRDDRYAQVARDTFAWVEREMAAPGGGFASSLDADTHGEEGLTYTWTVSELREALGPEDGAFAASVYGATEEGNFRDEASGRRSGRNVLHLPVPLDRLAAAQGTTLPALRARLDRVRARLLEVRAGRHQPPRDGKVLTAWNALLASAYAQAGTALRDPALVAKGAALARLLLERSRDGGRLLRFPRDSGPPILGFLEDHAHLADALLDVAAATGDASLVAEARALADAMLERFADPAGGFFQSSTEHEVLLARTKEAFDTPIPSGNATAVRVLLRLAARGADPRYRAAADRTVAAFRWVAERAPTGATAMVRAIADRLRLPATGAEALPPGDVRERRGPAQVDVYLERGEAKPGASVGVLVRIVLDEGWHVNGPSPARTDRVASTLATAAGAPARLEAVRWPATATIGSGDAAVDGYEGTVDVRGRLSIPADAPPGPRRIALVLTLQPCDASSCRRPEEVRLDVPLRFGDEGPARHPSLFR